MVELRNKVKDKVTRYVGVAVARLDAINKEPSIAVRLSDNPLDLAWLPEHRLEVINANEFQGDLFDNYNGKD